MSINSTKIVFRPDTGRVLNRPFIPADPNQVSSIIQRVLSFTESEVAAQLSSLREEFDHRHPNLERSWSRQFQKVQSYLSNHGSVSDNRQLLIGAFFTGEYAIESAALCNPSIVPHPDQTGLEPGDLRFVLSLRAVGEGHISSIEFRGGVIRNDHSIRMDSLEPLVTAADINPDPTFPKSVFLHRLKEEGLENNWSRSVMSRLNNAFTRTELSESMLRASQEPQLYTESLKRAIECVHGLVRSNYQLDFDPSIPLAERVIFPVSLNESNGIEDARFVRFVDDDESVTFYATYTAYNGRTTFPQLIETTDFLQFRIHTLSGSTIRNKGMALFPKRIDGRYAMLSRYDDENLYLMFSDDLYFWNTSQLLLRPSQPWEFIKVGNCGSPIETDAGWLVLTHGVGPMRKYCISAMLLDLHKPSEIIARLERPFLEPAKGDTDGYVPNVVYSCGALVHNGQLVLPYGQNDSTAIIITIELQNLLAEMLD